MKRTVVNTRLPVVLSLLVAASGCVPGPIWAPTLEGTIVHEQTGEPLVGAMVVSNYDLHNYPFAGRCTRTDEQGHFLIPGHTVVFWYRLAATINGPTVIALHRSSTRQSWSQSEHRTRTGEWLDRRKLRLRWKAPIYPMEPSEWESSCFDFAAEAEDVRTSRMHSSCEAIFYEECPGMQLR
jgi:hypothetical protein